MASVCSGSIVDAVVHITIGGMLYFPMQVRPKPAIGTVAVAESDSGAAGIYIVRACACVVFTLFCFVLSVFCVQVWLLRQHVNWPLALELSFYLEIGLVAGTYVLVSFDSPWLLRSLGLLFFIVAVQKLGLEIPKDPSTIPPTREERYVVDTREKRLTLIGLGLTSGVFGGLFATGGPPLMVFVAITHIQKDEWRSTVAFCYFVENVTRFIYLVLIRKEIDLESEYLIAVAMVVSSVVGLAIGNKIAVHINQTLFRRLIVAVLACGSLMMLTSGFESWLMGTLISAGVLVFLGYGMLLVCIQDRHKRYSKMVGLASQGLSEAASDIMHADGCGDIVEIELVVEESDENDSVVANPRDQEMQMLL